MEHVEADFLAKPEEIATGLKIKIKKVSVCGHTTSRKILFVADFR